MNIKMQSMLSGSGKVAYAKVYANERGYLLNVIVKQDKMSVIVKMPVDSLDVEELFDKDDVICFYGLMRVKWHKGVNEWVIKNIECWAQEIVFADEIKFLRLTPDNVRRESLKPAPERLQGFC
jgi:hypothetical protein